MEFQGRRNYTNQWPPGASKPCLFPSSELEPPEARQPHRPQPQLWQDLQPGSLVRKEREGRTSV